MLPRERITKALARDVGRGRPALESSHALAAAQRWAAKNAGARVLIGLSGRGDKDMPILAKYPMAGRHHAAA